MRGFRHRAEAVVEAARLLDLMLDRGDMEDRQVWLRIRGAIVQLVVRPAAERHAALGREPQPGRSTAISAGHRLRNFRVHGRRSSAAEDRSLTIR
jgi:hypothetical protein